MVAAQACLRDQPFVEGLFPFLFVLEPSVFATKLKPKGESRSNLVSKNEPPLFCIRSQDQLMPEPNCVA